MRAVKLILTIVVIAAIMLLAIIIVNKVKDSGKNSAEAKEKIQKIIKSNKECLARENCKGLEAIAEFAEDNFDKKQ